MEEVVLVDDESELDHLHGKLDREINKPFYKGRVTLVRNKEREGLIRSRNNGALAARGEVSFRATQIEEDISLGSRVAGSIMHCIN